MKKLGTHSWDLLAGGGVLLTGAGLWIVSPAAALIVVGLLLTATGVYGARATAWAEARRKAQQR